MLIPIAKGSKPKMVVIAVNKTGLKRFFPPSTILSWINYLVKTPGSKPSSIRFLIIIKLV
jgi:hypothetical protein